MKLQCAMKLFCTMAGCTQCELEFYDAQTTQNFFINLNLCCFKDSLHNWPASFNYTSSYFLETIKANHIKGYHTNN